MGWPIIKAAQPVSIFEKLGDYTVKPETNDDDVLCPSCLTPNGPFEAFCHSCRSPIGATATLDPIHTIKAEGFLFRKAVEGKPKPIVLAGIWLIFLPLLVFSIYAAIRLILDRPGFIYVLFFWAFIGFAYVAFVILYRVTKNYLRGQKKPDTLQSSSGGA